MNSTDRSEEELGSKLWKIVRGCFESILGGSLHAAADLAKHQRKSPVRRLGFVKVGGA